MNKCVYTLVLVPKIQIVNSCIIFHVVTYLCQLLYSAATMFARGSPRISMMQATCTQKKLSPKSARHKKGLSPKVLDTQKKKTSSPKGSSFILHRYFHSSFTFASLQQAYNRT
jgi:hypothetical protein